MRSAPYCGPKIVKLGPTAEGEVETMRSLTPRTRRGLSEAVGLPVFLGVLAAVLVILGRLLGALA